METGSDAEQATQRMEQPGPSRPGSKHRGRKVVAALAIVMILVLAVLLVRGVVLRRREEARDRVQTAIENRQDQGQSGASGQSSGGASQGAPADQSGGGQSGGQLAPAQEAPAGGGAAPVPVEESPGFIEIVDENVTPYRAAAGSQRAFQTSVTGPAVSVTMSISGPGGAFTVSLVSSPDFNGQTNWSAERAGPSVPGEYSYTATAVSSDGHSVSAPGGVFIVE